MLIYYKRCKWHNCATEYKVHTNHQCIRSSVLIMINQCDAGGQRHFWWWICCRFMTGDDNEITQSDIAKCITLYMALVKDVKCHTRCKSHARLSPERPGFEPNWLLLLVALASHFTDVCYLVWQWRILYGWICMYDMYDIWLLWRQRCQMSYKMWIAWMYGTAVNVNDIMQCIRHQVTSCQIIICIPECLAVKRPDDNMTTSDPKRNSSSRRVAFVWCGMSSLPVNSLQST